MTDQEDAHLKMSDLSPIMSQTEDHLQGVMKMLICTVQGCGFKNLSDSRYCEMCGKPLKTKQEDMSLPLSSPRLEAIHFTVCDSNSVISLTDVLHLLSHLNGTSNNGRQQAGEHIQMIVHQREERLTIANLGDIESVKVNGKLLPPYTPYKLANSDWVISLGHLDVAKINNKSVGAYDEVEATYGDTIILGKLKLSVNFGLK